MATILDNQKNEKQTDTDIKTKLKQTNIEKIWRESKYIKEYTEPKILANYKNGKDIRYNLKAFVEFVFENYNTNIDDMIDKLAKINDFKDSTVYKLLSKYLTWLQKRRNLDAQSLRSHVIFAKILMSTSEVLILQEKFREHVKFPRVVKRKKFPLSKKIIRTIILGLDNNKRTRAYVTFLAATGLRAKEALYIRNKDIDWTKNPVQVFIHGEHTKTKVDRITFLTQESAEILRQWLTVKYAERDISTKRTTIITNQEVIKRRQIENSLNVKPHEDDLVFAPFHVNRDKYTRKGQELDKHTQYIYQWLREDFAQTLKLIKLGELEASKKRMKITLHSFRRYVKTTISSLGYSDFSEGFIGHASSTYWTLADEEQIKLFRIVEPYLTYLDYENLEAQGADFASKIQTYEETIRNLKEQVLQVKTSIDSSKPALDTAMMQRIKELHDMLIGSNNNSSNNTNSTLNRKSSKIELQDQQQDKETEEAEIERKYHELQKKKRILQLQQELATLKKQI